MEKPQQNFDNLNYGYEIEKDIYNEENNMKNRIKSFSFCSRDTKKPPELMGIESEDESDPCLPINENDQINPGFNHPITPLNPPENKPPISPISIQIITPLILTDNNMNIEIPNVYHKIS